MKTLILHLVILCLLVGCGTTPVEENPFLTEAPQIDNLNALVAAHNLHEVDSVLIFFSQQASISVENNFTLAGIEGVRRLEVWDSVINSQWVVSNSRFRQDTVFFSATETNRWFSSAGIGTCTYESGHAVFNADGKISRLHFTLSPESMQASKKVIKDIFNWAEGTDEMFALNKILPSGQMKIDAESAHAWLEMIERWQE